MILRFAEKEDRAKLMELFARLDEEKEYPAGEKLDHAAAELPDKAGMIAVAEDAEKIVGYLSAVRKEEECTILFGVLKAYSNRGLIKMMMAMLEDWAYENSVKRAYTFVKRENHAALHILLRHGFEGARQIDSMTRMQKDFPDVPRYVKPVVEANELLNWAFID